MSDLARRQAVLTSQHTLAARRLYELIQATIRAHSYEANRGRLIALIDEAATAARELAPIDAAQRQASEERLAEARATAAQEQAAQSRAEAEARAATRARNRSELIALRQREGP